MIEAYNFGSNIIVCFNGPKEEWLDTPVNDLLARHPDPEQIPRTLRRRRLPMPVRELLVHGEPRLHGLGQEARIALKALTNENKFGIEWKSAPTPEDIAHTCQRLSQVSAGVLKLDFASGLSINDVLQTPCDNRSGLRSSYIKDLRPYVTAHELDQLANGPEVFAIRFASVRLGYSTVLSGETTLQMPDE